MESQTILIANSLSGQCLLTGSIRQSKDYTSVYISDYRLDLHCLVCHVNLAKHLGRLM